MKKLICFILLGMMILLTGCNRKTHTDQEIPSTGYKIFYIDSKNLGLVSQSYKPNGTTTGELVQELLDALRKEPKNVVYKKALPDAVTIKDYEVSNENSLLLDFEANYYSELQGIPDVLCRATIVKTLCQIPGLEYVLFNVNGLPMEDSNGIQIGLMKATDFIESTGSETNYKVILYYADEDGEALVASNSNIIYTGSGKIEEMIINQLINGPVEVGMKNTIPEGTTLLDVTTREGICYVDFNEKFLDVIPGVSGDVTLYSIVNSLVELPNINKVQFYINSTLRETYQDDTDPLNGFFERNLDIIEEGSR
ncbi:MAG TPA: GerMN domain-containing protein [Mobilitalea sp.]|nr:GerMN domain-containing protein [Mobilitalea sp.]